MSFEDSIERMKQVAEEEKNRLLGIISYQLETRLPNELNDRELIYKYFKKLALDIGLDFNIGNDSINFTEKYIKILTDLQSKLEKFEMTTDNIKEVNVIEHSQEMLEMLEKALQEEKIIFLEKITQGIIKKHEKEIEEVIEYDEPSKTEINEQEESAKQEDEPSKAEINEQEESASQEDESSKTEVDEQEESAKQEDEISKTEIDEQEESASQEDESSKTEVDEQEFINKIKQLEEYKSSLKVKLKHTIWPGKKNKIINEIEEISKEIDELRNESIIEKPIDKYKVEVLGNVPISSTNETKNIQKKENKKPETR